MNTKDIILRLNELNKCSKQLDTQEPERLEMMKSVTDYANQFISGLDTVKAFQEKEATSLEINNQKGQYPIFLNCIKTKSLKLVLMPLLANI